MLRESADDAADPGSGESPEEDVEAPEPEGADRNGTVQTFHRLEFSAAQVSGVAAVASELEALLGRTHPRQGDNRLPRLSFMPVEWSNDDYLSYAADADDAADDCDDEGKCPIPPRASPSEEGSPRGAALNAITNTVRSPSTLLLLGSAWIWRASWRSAASQVCQ